jgi:hypothetical protein
MDRALRGAHKPFASALRASSHGATTRRDGRGARRAGTRRLYGRGALCAGPRTIRRQRERRLDSTGPRCFDADAELIFWR